LIQEKQSQRNQKRQSMTKFQDTSLTKSLKIQVIIGLIGVLVFGVYGQWLDAIYGFFIGLVNVLILAISFARANRKAEQDPKGGIQILYLSAVMRFILLAVLFVLGLQAFGLAPMPVVLTFVVMQLAQVFNLKGKQRLTD